MVIEANENGSKNIDIEIIQVPSFGFLRLKQVLKIIPISKTAWWDGVKEGRFPQSIKLSTRTTVWNVEDIRNLVKRLIAQGARV